VAVATTGNAGPDASEDKPVGLLHMVVDIEGRQVCQETRYSTTRSEYKRRGALEALALLWRELKHAP
jgi:nicotinamide-nucleotide amidase